MSIIRDFARIKHHTITTIGATFSIPPQEDFTLGFGLGTTQSWSPTDLYVSEIGVNETDNKAFIRIGNSINEFSFIGSTSSIPSLDQVLSVGNDTQGTSIVYNDSVGGGLQDVRYDDLVNSASSTISLSGGGSSIYGYDNAGNYSFIVNTYSTSFEVGGGGGQQTVTKYYNTQTIGTASVDIIISSTIPTTSSLRSVNVVVRGAGVPSGNAYVANLFAAFDGSTQLSTTSIVEKTTFTFATSDVYCDSNFIYVKLYGELGDTIDWFFKVTIDA